MYVHLSRVCMYVHTAYPHTHMSRFILKVVEDAVFQNEPSLALGLVFASFLGEPPLSFRIEECLC